MRDASYEEMCSLRVRDLIKVCHANPDMLVGADGVRLAYGDGVVSINEICMSVVDVPRHAGPMSERIYSWLRSLERRMETYLDHRPDKHDPQHYQAVLEQGTVVEECRALRRSRAALRAELCKDVSLLSRFEREDISVTRPLALIGAARRGSYSVIMTPRQTLLSRLDARNVDDLLGVFSGGVVYEVLGLPYCISDDKEDIAHACYPWFERVLSQASAQLVYPYLDPRAAN